MASSLRFLFITMLVIVMSTVIIDKLLAAPLDDDASVDRYGRPCRRIPLPPFVVCIT